MYSSQRLFKHFSNGESMSWDITEIGEVKAFKGCMEARKLKRSTMKKKCHLRHVLKKNELLSDFTHTVLLFT